MELDEGIRLNKPPYIKPHDEVSEKHYLAYGSRLAGGEEVGVSAFVAHGVAAVVLGRNMMSRTTTLVQSCCWKRNVLLLSGGLLYCLSCYFRDREEEKNSRCFATVTKKKLSKIATFVVDMMKRKRPAITQLLPLEESCHTTVTNVQRRQRLSCYCMTEERVVAPAAACSRCGEDDAGYCQEKSSNAAEELLVHCSRCCC
ncbi:hypothetical protein NC653_037828 [Populus alba x Populus x berolinensis]|uniref:Uncharacterized protein n=1 Tax=Populus alba x Populus x berolinensis TaxID=444605 RepID=A0AAD6PSH6_9ROSI|nr:hypothetical protein NC653_037828 [Populus alba x Populus x berolinensis]